MKIDRRKLDFVLAEQCKSISDLRTPLSSVTISRIRRGEDVMPKTAGRLAKALGVNVADLLEQEATA